MRDFSLITDIFLLLASTQKYDRGYKITASIQNKTVFPAHLVQEICFALFTVGALLAIS